jgi:phosphoglycolate phosphatase-like HAD superfamily hydrolase
MSLDGEMNLLLLRGKWMHLLLDLDETLMDAAWRAPLIDGNGWDFYHEQLIHDKPIPEVLALTRGLFFAGWKVHALTARPERFRTHTLKTLIKFTVPVERVLMRADNDRRRSPDVKMDMVLNNFEGISRSRMIAIDDREDVVLAYKSLGIVTFQIHRSFNLV